MRALQNGYILVMIIMVTLYATNRALNDGEVKS